MLRNEIYYLTFEVSNLSITFFFKIISYEGPNIYDIHTERNLRGLKIYCLFMGSIDFKQHIYSSLLQMGGGYRGQKISNFLWTS